LNFIEKHNTFVKNLNGTSYPETAEASMNIYQYTWDRCPYLRDANGDLISMIHPDLEVIW
jgi:hypothetical protein